ncbi:Hypothetical protein NTJ_11182 [Nesidiocoris tenuis]|uniref:Uncharacterized protein n=1 Tax=Nesidiocoris tenuis TaxID=355587 RepID=A0ABN7B1S1_9HEMI|nr:Hypothetical protein NTJ_11182 [Nesidiocoris tenuis]
MKAYFAAPCKSSPASRNPCPTCSTFRFNKEQMALEKKRRNFKRFSASSGSLALAALMGQNNGQTTPRYTWNFESDITSENQSQWPEPDSRLVIFSHTTEKSH